MGWEICEFDSLMRRKSTGEQRWILRLYSNKFAGFVCNSNRCELDNRLGLFNIPKLTLL